MHAYLFTGGTADERNKNLLKLLSDENVSAMDTIRLDLDERGSISIESVRTFLKLLLLAPRQSPKTAGVIPFADLLTPQSQNALLKTLEEPPPHSMLILLAEDISSILGTVQSRCTHIRLPKNAVSDNSRIQLIDELMALPQGKLLLRIDTIAGTREQTAIWIRDTITTLHADLIEKYRKSEPVPHSYPSLVLSLLGALRKLSLNISPKTALDAAFLGWKGEKNLILGE